MRDWQNDAPKMIAAIHKSLPDASPDDLRKALRKAAYNFHGGTSWGQKVWSKHCRIYMDKLIGGTPASRRSAVSWPADICFLFRTEEPKP
jgi:hypothetical protein